jgi:hypothetical protein
MQRREINPTDWLLGFNINLVAQFRQAWSNLKEPELMIELEATAVA